MARADADRRHAGRAPERAPEAALSRAAALTCVALAVPAGAIAATAAGVAGALGALVGIALVAVMYGVSGLLLTWAARFGDGAVAAAGFAGFVVRLPLYLLALAVVWPVEGVHKPSLIAAVGVAVVATLAAEIGTALRRPELFWVRTETSERTRA